MATPTEYFDTLYPHHINGHIDPMVVLDQDGTPNRVLELDRTWSLTVNWRLVSDAPASDPVDTIDGTWHLVLSIDELGGADEHPIANFSLPLANHLPGATSAKCEWSHKFNFNVGVIHKEAVYKLIMLITYTDHHGLKRQMAGFMEGPVVTFYRETLP